MKGRFPPHLLQQQAEQLRMEALLEAARKRVSISLPVIDAASSMEAEIPCQHAKSHHVIHGWPLLRDHSSGTDPGQLRSGSRGITAGAPGN